ncbi:hypothetical protein TNIN_473381 [Trichonephila inaurata madagascariensis]|uniref:Uncharacterized protein n=1 Tax=Trichonephila inaurata madagascariensis TaxID=2747483 RepID=A0A8X6XA73_9ARAC|nr:hypothetical protein TNIN_473381 [Trichonephila inaurata madagascariensis]
MGRKKQIPDRWLNYHPMKEWYLDDTCIIPLNVLYQLIKVSKVKLSMQWHVGFLPTQWISIPNLGLVIDITNKQPSYYDPKEFIPKWDRCS